MSDWTDPPCPNPECRRCEGKGKWWPDDYAKWQPCRCGPQPPWTTPEMQVERDRIARIILRGTRNLSSHPVVQEVLREIAGSIQDSDDNGWDYQ